MERLPEWLLEFAEHYLSSNIDKMLNRNKLSKRLEVMKQLFESLNWPKIEHPPDETLGGGYYGDSWTWIWRLPPEDDDNTFLRLRVDLAGRAEIWFQAGKASDKISGVACRWGFGHKFKYGYLPLGTVKVLWEIISNHDQKAFNDILPCIELKYYDHRIPIAKL